MKKEEIDRRLRKADHILSNAEELKQKTDFDLSVRRSQEAFELYLKTLFSELGHTYPKKHNLKEQIYEVRKVLDPEGTGDFDVIIAALVMRNEVLSLWRNRAFYGDERLNVSGMFTEKEAELALIYAKGMRRASLTFATLHRLSVIIDRLKKI